MPSPARGNAILPVLVPGAVNAARMKEIVAEARPAVFTARHGDRRSNRLPRQASR